MKPLERIRRHGRMLVLALVLTITPSLMSCYGRFPLTKAVYEFNGDVTDDELAQSLLMWAFIIIPVYSVAMTGDALIFNLIEFWTGEQFGVASGEMEDGTAWALAPSEDGRRATLTLSRDGQTFATRMFVRTESGTIEAYDESGALIGEAVPTEVGGFTLINAEGQTVDTVPADLVLNI